MPADWILVTISTATSWYYYILKFHIIYLMEAGSIVGKIIFLSDSLFYWTWSFIARNVIDIEIFKNNLFNFFSFISNFDKRIINIILLISKYISIVNIFVIHFAYTLSFSKLTLFHWPLKYLVYINHIFKLWWLNSFNYWTVSVVNLN
jgi:hypothetical protein